ncbi:MAG: zinc ribbon domain-containing protein [Candidatus Xenobia bacterium]
MFQLYRLQQTDLKVTETEQRLAGLGAPKELLEQLEDAKKRLADAEEALRKSSTELKNGELELSSKESKKQQLDQKLYSGKVVNPKELAGLQEEIDDLVNQKGKLEERILELMDTVDGQKATVETIKAEIQHASQALEEAKASASHEKETLQAALSEQREKRKGLAGQVEESLLKRYETLRSRKDGVAVARVKGGCCMVCGVAIPPTSKKSLEAGQMETCKTCGRILIVETAETPSA